MVNRDKIVEVAVHERVAGPGDRDWDTASGNVIVDVGGRGKHRGVQPARNPVGRQLLRRRVHEAEPEKRAVAQHEVELQRASERPRESTERM